MRPMMGLLAGYQKDWFRFDSVAGLTTAAVVIPQSMAYASIAGLPVPAGLYVALVPMFVYALLGTSRPLSVSSTSTLAIPDSNRIDARCAWWGPSSPDGGSLHARPAGGRLPDRGRPAPAGVPRQLLISDPVLTGFKAGIGLIIAVDQAPKLLGVHIEKGHFFRKILSVLEHVPETSRATLLLAAATLAILVAMKHFFHGPLLHSWQWSSVSQPPDYWG